MRNLKGYVAVGARWQDITEDRRSLRQRLLRACGDAS